MTPFQFIREKSSEQIRRISYLAVAALSTFFSLILLFVPFCTYKNLSPTGLVSESNKLTPWSALSLLSDENALADGIAYLGLVIFLLWLACIIVVGIMVIKMLFRFGAQEEKMQKSAKNILLTNSILTGVYFLGGFIFNLVNRASGGQTSTANNITPFLLCLFIDAVFAFYLGILRDPDEEDVKEETLVNKRKKLAKMKGVLFTFVFGLLVCAMLAFFTNIITVTFTNTSMASYNFGMNGADLLRDYATLEESAQTLAFVLLLLLTVVLTFFFLTLVSLLSKSVSYFRFAIGSVVASCLSCFLVGMYGKYYEIIEISNIEMINSLFQSTFGTSFTIVSTDFKVTSSSFYFFLLAIVLLGILLIFRPYSKGIVLAKELDPDTNKLVASIDLAEVKLDHVSEDEKTNEPVPAPVVLGGGGFGTGAEESLFANPCPAFAELDGKAETWLLEAGNKKNTALFENPTLPKLVQFIVQYARDSRLHLFYTAEDIAAFIAGLGMSKLTILQGMSGTGKTSLPKIFTEALYSNCEIIEVESSWRDKNELLGYYNEFSKTYTPKKFTQALYKARLNPQTLTFIVLDEMNLSRIEYYFSDFLSLMENEPDKREIKLLNVGLYQKNNGVKRPYRGLTDGHTIKIPPNVWFIGTANRDESTFEISDKVYDRAHTMNFNKRAKKVRAYNEARTQQFLPANVFADLLEDAKKTVSFDVENYPIIAEVEKLLAPYNISFGNRIAMQIEAFVSIYCACFTPTEETIHDAVERILLSKVVSKLELKSVDNKEELAAAFDQLGLPRCSEFVSKLNED